MSGSEPYRARELASLVEVRQLSRQIHDLLRARILRRELAPGDKLVPVDLALSLGVSITPVRDAVNLLAADGLVIVSPRRGTVVAPFSETDIHELYQIRLMLEPVATEQAALALSDDELSSLANLADQLEHGADAAAEDVEAYLRSLATDAEFHAGIVRGARNRRLTALYQSLQTTLIVARAIYPNVYRGDTRREAEHRKILSALQAHDPALARAAIVEHLVRSRDATLRHMHATRTNATSATSSAVPD